MDHCTRGTTLDCGLADALYWMVEVTQVSDHLEELRTKETGGSEIPVVLAHLP